MINADQFAAILREQPPVYGQPLPTGLNDAAPALGGTSIVLYLVIAELVERVQVLEKREV